MSSSYPNPAVVRGVTLDNKHVNNFGSNIDRSKVIPQRGDLLFLKKNSGFYTEPGVISVFNLDDTSDLALNFVGVCVHSAADHFQATVPCQLTGVASIHNTSLDTFELGEAVYARKPTKADPLPSKKSRHVAILEKGKTAQNFLIGRVLSRGVSNKPFEVLLHGGQ